MKANKKAYNRAYYLIHKEDIKRASMSYYWGNLKTIKARKKKYMAGHREQKNKREKERYQVNPKVKAGKKEYYLMHQKQKTNYNERYYLVNQEEIKRKCVEYSQTPAGRETIKRRTATRRQLGFIPLNKPFLDSRGHHIDKERVIYVPRQMHEGNPHSLLRNRNMDRINELAFNFLTGRG